MSMSANLLRRAIELYRAGNKDEANRLLKTVVRQEPTNQIAWNWYIETLDDPSQRIAALEEYLLINPDSRQAAKTLAALKQQAATQEATRAVAIEPVAELPSPVPEPSQPLTVVAPTVAAPPAAPQHASYASLIAVFSILLLMVIFIYTFKLQQDRDALQAHYTDLQTNFTNLQVAHEVTLQEKTELKTQLDDLWVDYDYLNTVYNDLSKAYVDLETRFNSLAQAYLDLDARYNSLQQDYGTLKGSYSDLKTNYSQLTGDYDALRANYTNLYGWYEWLQTNAVKPPYIAIHNRQVTLGFYGPYGTVETWTKDISELEHAITTGQYYRDNPTYLSFKVDGEEVVEENYLPFIDPDPFRSYISYLYGQSGSDLEFIQNIRIIISQLTLYNQEYYEIPRHPLETFLLGGGDCEDTSILLASMLLAAPVDWDVRLVFMDADHPQDAQWINHVIVYVNTGTEEYLLESTNPDYYWGFDTQGWYLDVNN
jgi:hypothetical protein